MCNPATQAQIEDLVQRNVSGQAMFTAYDITKAIRAEGVSILHDEVRAIVHSMYCNSQMGIEYERTLVDVGGARGPAYIYHRYDSDPGEYANALQGQMSTPSIPPTGDSSAVPTNPFDLTSIRQMIDRLNS